MKRYNFAKIMYDILPPIYKDRDDEAVPTPYPLRRFYQLAGIALDDLQVIISKLYNLYDIPRQSEEIIDELAKSFGFDFPENFTLDEKRLFLYNFPRILSMKGTDEIYEAIAHIFFYRDATVSTEWEYRDFEEYGERTVTVDLDVPDTIPDFDEKRKKFDEIVEYFRTINVNIAWNISVFYDYVVRLRIIDEYNFDDIDMNDNYTKREYDRLNYGTLPFMLAKGRYFPEAIGSKIGDYLTDSINYDDEERSNMAVQDILYDDVQPTTDEDPLIVRVEGNEFGESKVEQLFFEDVEVETGENLVDSIYTLTTESNELDLIENEQTSTIEFITVSFDLNVEMGDGEREDITYDFRNMLNRGLLNSTIILGELPKVTIIKERGKDDER